MDRKPGHPRSWIVATMMTVLLLYVASIPPLVWCIRKAAFPVGSTGFAIAGTYFAPFDWCVNNCPPTSDLLVRYAELLAD